MTRFLAWIQSPLLQRVVALFLLLALVPTLLLSIVAQSLVRVSHQHDVAALEQLLLAEKSDELQKFFADTLGILDLRVGYTQRSPIALAEQDFLLQGILEENENILDVRLMDLDGKETSRRNRDGVVEELQNAMLLPEFRVAASGESYVGDVVSTIVGPVVTLAAPVRNRQGDIIQVLAADVALAPLAQSIRAARLGTAGYLTLLDREGRLIASGAPTSAVGTPLVSVPLVAATLAGRAYAGTEEEARYVSELSQELVVAASRQLPNTGWLMFVEWPVRDADAVLDSVRRQTIAVTALSIAVVALLAPLFASRLTRPIRQLQQGAAAIEQGNFDYIVSIRTNDELEELGTSFNTMAGGLKRLQELKNEFVFIAAHELRTPVTAIRGYVSMLLEEPKELSAITKKYLGTIWNVNERLVQLVNDILEIARSEAGRMKVAVAPLDLHASIAQVMTEVTPLAKERNIELTFDGERIPSVLADDVRLKEVLMNFLSNAIKYNRDNGFVRVRAKVVSGAVAVSVEDNGYGLSPEEQSHLFEKFFRSEAPEYRKVPGTGLGLFITRELVERMGGTVSFASEKGKGTTFTFTLRIAPAGGAPSAS